MLRKTMSMIAVAAILAMSAPAAAFAAEEDPYTPNEPGTPTLAGSVAVGECVGDVPYISYDVTLTDPDDQVTSHAAALILSSGSNSVALPLGTLVDGHLSGRVLWPGASVDGAGNPTGWPGWAFENGQWVETSGNFAWTRGSISAVIQVNPDLSVPLSYPAATPNCMTNPPTALSAETPSDILAVTGGSLPYVAAGVGAGLVALGATAVFLRRRSVRS